MRGLFFDKKETLVVKTLTPISSYQEIYGHLFIVCIFPSRCSRNSVFNLLTRVLYLESKKL